MASLPWLSSLKVVPLGHHCYSNPHLFTCLSSYSPFPSSSHSPSPSPLLPLPLAPAPAPPPPKAAFLIDDSKFVRHLESYGVEPTPKILYRLRKKEVQKLKRKQKKKDEAERARALEEAACYDWPRTHAPDEFEKLREEESAEELANAFLCSLHDAKPEARIRTPAAESRPPSSLARSRKSRVFRKGGANRNGRRDTNSAVGLPEQLRTVEDLQTPLTLQKFENMPVIEANRKPSSSSIWSKEGRVFRKGDANDTNNAVGLPEQSLTVEDSQTSLTLRKFENMPAIGINRKFSSLSIQSRESRVFRKRDANDTNNVVGMCEESKMMEDLQTSSTLQKFENMPAIGIRRKPSFSSIRSEEGRVFRKGDANGAERRSAIDGTIDLVQTGSNRQNSNKTCAEPFIETNNGSGMPKQSQDWQAFNRTSTFEERNTVAQMQAVHMTQFPVDLGSLQHFPAYNSSLITKQYIDSYAMVREDRRIQSLARRLNKTEGVMHKVHFNKRMHSGKMKLREDRIIRVLQLLGQKRNWKRAMEVVDWVDNRQRFQYFKSRPIYTTLVSVLGENHKSEEAWRVFQKMREDLTMYPDMAAYRCIAVILGQDAKLKELLKLIVSMRHGPFVENKSLALQDFRLSPDIVVYNAVINACIPHKNWRVMEWVWGKLKVVGLSPNAATYGLTMEVLVKSGKLDKIHGCYEDMRRAGFSLEASTYKILVEAFGKAGQAENALKVVEYMKVFGTTPTASVYYSLACCLCAAGKWQDAVLQIKKMQYLPSKKSDVITFTGLIRACHTAGKIEDAISLFQYMREICVPNINTYNIMINIYGGNQLFHKAKTLYESVVRKGRLAARKISIPKHPIAPDAFTFRAMLNACVESEEWNYFRHVYKEMQSHGYFFSEKDFWLVSKVTEAGQKPLVDLLLSKM